MARYPGVDENDFITFSLRVIELAPMLESSGDCVFSIDVDCGSEEVHIFDGSVAPCCEELATESVC